MLPETAFIHLFQMKENFMPKLWAGENNKSLTTCTSEMQLNLCNVQKKNFRKSEIKDILSAAVKLLVFCIYENMLLLFTKTNEKIHALYF